MIERNIESRYSDVHRGKVLRSLLVAYRRDRFPLAKLARR